MSTKTTKQPTGTTTTVEALASDATSQDVAYPDGCPELIPVLRLPRSRRADYYDAMSRVSEMQRSASGAEKVADESRPVEIRLAEVADMNRMLAAIEDLLAVVAADPDEFRAWALDVDDSILVEAFNAYIARTQPGEASSSAS
jgi:hypothetical protein